MGHLRLSLQNNGYEMREILLDPRSENFNPNNSLGCVLFCNCIIQNKRFLLLLFIDILVPMVGHFYVVRTNAILISL